MNANSNRLNERLEPLLKGLAFDGQGDRLASWERALFEIATRLSLTANQYATIEEHYQALQAIFDAATDPQLASSHIFLQGSIRARTAILPHPDATGDEAEVDADAMLWLPRASSSPMSVYASVEKRLRYGTRTDRSPTKRNRCIRLHYRDTSPGFHMDVTPARNAPGNASTLGEGHLNVPDCATETWKDSAPVDYADWFEGVCNANLSFQLNEAIARGDELLGKSSLEPAPDHDSYIDFNPLRAAIKLMKAHRDSYFVRSSIKHLRPISIIITTLAARAYETIAKESATAPRRAAAVLIEIVDRMPQFLLGVEGARIVANPVIASENFAEKWALPGGTKLENAFLDWHSELTRAVRLGLWAFPSKLKLEEALNKAFGERATPASAELMLKATGSQRVAPLAFDVSQRAPEEQFIEEQYPVNIQHQLELDCKVMKASEVLRMLRKSNKFNRWLPFGRRLEFFVGRCTVPKPYQLFWKVRNVGPSADNRKQWRGAIEADKGEQKKIERTDFGGEHYVEAYAVKNGVCVARDRILVPIGSK